MLSAPVGTPPTRAGLSLSRVAQWVVILVGIIGFAYFARPVLVPVILAWVGSMALKPPVRWLGKARCPLPVAALVVVGLFVGGLGFAAYRLGQPAIEWAKSAPENLPQLRQKFTGILRPAARLSAAASSVSNLTASEDPAKKSPAFEIKDNRVAGSVFSWTGSLLAGVGETLALLFLLLAVGDLLIQKLVRVLPTFHDKKHAVAISQEIEQNISGYLFSVGLVNLIFGVIIGFSCSWLGLPNAGMWGAVAVFANFIPYFGPILGMIAVGMASLLAFDSLAQGLLPPGVYLLCHLVEANLVTPFVLGRRCRLNPVVIFVALIFVTWLWGVAGALLAVPLLVTLKVICDQIPSWAAVGEFLSD